MSRALQLLSESKDRDDKLAFQQRVLANRLKKEAAERHSGAPGKGGNAPHQVPGTIMNPTGGTHNSGWQSSYSLKGEVPAKEARVTGNATTDPFRQNPNRFSGITPDNIPAWQADQELQRKENLQRLRRGYGLQGDEPLNQFKPFQQAPGDLMTGRTGSEAPFSRIPLSHPSRANALLKSQSGTPVDNRGIPNWREMETPYGEQDPFSHRSEPQSPHDPALIRHMKSKEELTKGEHTPTYKHGYKPEKWHKRYESLAQQFITHVSEWIGEE